MTRIFVYFQVVLHKRKWKELEKEMHENKYNSCLLIVEWRIIFNFFRICDTDVRMSQTLYRFREIF